MDLNGIPNIPTLRQVSFRFLLPMNFPPMPQLRELEISSISEHELLWPHLLSALSACSGLNKFALRSVREQEQPIPQDPTGEDISLPRLESLQLSDCDSSTTIRILQRLRVPSIKCLQVLNEDRSCGFAIFRALVERSLLDTAFLNNDNLKSLLEISAGDLTIKGVRHDEYEIFVALSSPSWVRHLNQTNWLEARALLGNASDLHVTFVDDDVDGVLAGGQDNAGRGNLAFLEHIPTTTVLSVSCSGTELARFFQEILSGYRKTGGLPEETVFPLVRLKEVYLNHPYPEVVWNDLSPIMISLLQCRRRLRQAFLDTGDLPDWVYDADVKLMRDGEVFHEATGAFVEEEDDEPGDAA